MIGREVMMRKQPGWNGYAHLGFANFVRATFKLTRDSQGATRSPTALEDFRTSFRDKRDPYLRLYLASLRTASFLTTGRTFEPTCNKLLITWCITVEISNSLSKSAPRFSSRTSPLHGFTDTDKIPRTPDRVSWTREIHEDHEGPKDSKRIGEIVNLSFEMRLMEKVLDLLIYTQISSTLRSKSSNASASRVRNALRVLDLTCVLRRVACLT